MELFLSENVKILLIKQKTGAFARQTIQLSAKGRRATLIYGQRGHTTRLHCWCPLNVRKTILTLSIGSFLRVLLIDLPNFTFGQSRLSLALVLQGIGNFS